MPPDISGKCIVVVLICSGIGATKFKFWVLRSWCTQSICISFYLISFTQGDEAKVNSDEILKVQDKISPVNSPPSKAAKLEKKSQSGEHFYPEIHMYLHFPHTCMRSETDKDTEEHLSFPVLIPCF